MIPSLISLSLQVKTRESILNHKQHEQDISILLHSGEVLFSGDCLEN